MTQDHEPTKRAFDAARYLTKLKGKGIERFLANIRIGVSNKASRMSACWYWQGYIGVNGYGRFSIGGQQVYAHRWSFEQEYGPIPDGLQIDHLCRVRYCVRPSHLEPVTQAENVRRGDAGVELARVNRSKTHCINGHPFDLRNTYVTTKGWRNCRACMRHYQRTYKARKAGVA